MQGSLRRCVVTGFSLICLASAGCLQVPYCLPELHYAPAVDANCKSSEVHAFRVDIMERSELKEGITAVHGEVVEHHELTRIPTASDGTTSTQIGLTFASGWRYVGVVNFTASSTDHAIALRFYRPGYETIILNPGENVRDLTWKKAPELNDQIKAVDDLMYGAWRRDSGVISVRQVLEPGTTSAAQREALLFGASEYTRLARDLSATNEDDQELRAQLLDKANRLRVLAEGKRNHN